MKGPGKTNYVAKALDEILAGKQGEHLRDQTPTAAPSSTAAERTTPECVIIRAGPGMFRGPRLYELRTRRPSIALVRRITCPTSRDFRYGVRPAAGGDRFGLIIFLHELGTFLPPTMASACSPRHRLRPGGFLPQGDGLSGAASRVCAQRLMGRLRATMIEGTPGQFPRDFAHRVPFQLAPLRRVRQDARSGGPEPRRRERCARQLPARVPWKRMVVICAGVVMNLITAALLFIVVFRVEPQDRGAGGGVARKAGGSPLR